MSDDDRILQALRNLRRDAPDVAHEVLGDALAESFPSDLTRLHLCVYRIMLAWPELTAVEAMEVVAKIGILLERKKEREE